MFQLAGERTTIGRSPDCEIFLDDVTVSRRHAVGHAPRRRFTDRGPRQPQRHVRQPPPHRLRAARGRRRGPDRQVPADVPRPMTTATEASNERRAPPLDDRGRVPAPEGGVPGHLDLEDPLPRGPGPARAAAHPGRLPPLQRGGRRAARDDPPPAARRVPPAPRDPPGAGRARHDEGAPPAPPGRPRRPRGRARPRDAVRARRDHRRAGARARGVRAARAAGRGRERLYRETDAEIALACGRLAALRHRAAPSQGFPHGRRPRGACSRRSSLRRCARATPSAARRASRTSRRSPSWPRSCRSCSSGATLRDLASKLSTSTSASKIRDVPDFPQPGIVFKDIMPLLADGEALAAAVDRLAEWAEPREPGPRPRRGGARLHHRRRAGLPARLRLRRRPQARQAPLADRGAKYALEYGIDTLELHADAISGGRAS